MDWSDPKRAVLLILLAAWASVAGTRPADADFQKALKTGKTEMKRFEHGGLKRSYGLYIPASYDQSKRVPLLVALHGGGCNAKNWPRITRNGFERLAEQTPFILVYPEGLKRQWNNERRGEKNDAQKNKVDDLGFITSLIDYLTEKFSIDKNRIYLTGVSDGGMMAHYFAARHADKVAAMATVIASIPKNLEGTLAPGRPIPVLMINGTDDPLILWNGGLIKVGRKICGSVISVEEAVNFWVKHNACHETPIMSNLPDRDPDDGTTVQAFRYDSGKSGCEVILYKIIGGGHTWPAYVDTRGWLMKKAITRALGRKSRDIDACEIIWKFFEDHPKLP